MKIYEIMIINIMNICIDKFAFENKSELRLLNMNKFI